MNHQPFDPSEWTLVDSPEALKRGIDRLSTGTGAFGVDAERASGFRYYPSAYLIQVNRRGAGTFVIDPTTVDDLSPLNEVMTGEEWILHAAIADLESLRERGLEPVHLFDTELAARLLGYERVNLGAVIHDLLGVELEKAHSAADWSIRPLPDSWLEYAAADVAYLPDVRDQLEAALIKTGKLDIAMQEFGAVLSKPAREERAEPWRRISRLSTLKDQRSLAVAKELWYARDQLAQERDIAPGRLLPDASIVVAAKMLPRSAEELARNRDFRGKESRTELSRWWRAILRGKQTDDLPPLRAPKSDELPHHRFWERRRPEAFDRLQRARQLLEIEAQRLQIPLENLLTPSVLRQLAWDPPPLLSPVSIADRLTELGARPWQTEATAQIIASSFVEDL